VHWLPTQKAANTCNSQFLLDETGMLLACSRPVAGNHHDMFEIEQLTELLNEAGLEVEGRLLNADAYFDSDQFRKLCSALKIEAYIAFNPRNGIVGEDYVYFDGSSTGEETWWSRPVPSLIALKPF
jgi:hypothetical protein